MNQQLFFVLYPKQTVKPLQWYLESFKDITVPLYTAADAGSKGIDEFRTLPDREPEISF